MKTKDLIKELQELDPEGELECCIDNLDIGGISIEPAYWDGSLQLVEKGPDGEILGMKILDSGLKLVLSPTSVGDFIMNYPDGKIDFSDLSENRKSHWRRFVELKRNETKKIKKEVCHSFFVDYVRKKVKDSGLAAEYIEDIANGFAKRQICYDDPMPQDILKMRRPEKHGDKVYDVIPSWNERRCLQYDREISITVTDGNLSITRIRKPGASVEIRSDTN